ncbi:MAG TPA: AAA family ATPase [Gemmatimonadales bacterium]|nr:AAA family ATPase [Gemmatimonadales bacterium]
MKTRAELAPPALCRRFDPADIPFATTASGPATVSMVGQPRAVAALRFGIGMARDGYNIFALGAPGTGKRTLALRSLEAHAATRAVPPDLCYVHNFDDSRRPRLLRLPAGTGAGLRRAMERLVDDLRAAIAGALESEDYQRRRQALEAEMKARPGQMLEGIQARAQHEGLDVVQTPTGLSVVATRDGQVISEAEFQKLPEAERGVVKGKVAALETELETMVRQIPRWLRQHHDRLRTLRREVTALAAGHLVDEVRRSYAAVSDVLAYLDAVQQDVVEHATELIEPDGALSDTLSQALPRSFGRPVAARRYVVNVIVDQAGRTGAPVVLEDNPTYDNLIGRIEHLSQFGALVTDFTLIKAGALHRANGGYLVLDARDLLRAPFSWDALKRVLRSRRLRIESAGQSLSLVDTVSLEPEPVALDVQLVLLGEPSVYYLLCALDPDFAELFKVAADFADEVDADDEHRREYAMLIAALVQQAGLKPFDRRAVARVMEHSARLAGHQEKLSTRLSVLADLLAEADHWAGEGRADVVTATHVQRAIDQQLHRTDRLRDRVYEEIARRTVMIDTEGTRAGQVNGISVSALGPLVFGRPTRITARARIGRGDVVDIEREVELGGPVHSKGVLILGAYLGARYSPSRPLSLSASLVFEQSYAPVEGDSASAAELFALLSAVANVPIRQCLGVTGSVNQHGEIQAVGAINEKIEGFFDICRARGLTGEHGVVIPAANAQHLMLRQDVVDAVGRGLFHVYPVGTVDEAMALLTGLPALDRDASGEFPEGSLNHLIEARLAEFAETLPTFNGTSYSPA